jgi:uncharacterized protein HemX
MKWYRAGVVLWFIVLAIGVCVFLIGYPRQKNMGEIQDWQARKVLKLDKAQGEHRRAIADIERKMQTSSGYIEAMEKEIKQLDAELGLIRADIYDLEKWQTHVEEKVEGAKMPKPKSRYAPGGLYGGSWRP